MTTFRKKSKLATHIALLIDSSGSMGGFERGVVDSYRRQIAKIREKASADHEVHVRVGVFGDPAFKWICSDVKPSEVPDLDEYRPNAGTPLYFSVNEAIKEMPQRADVSYLIVTITDGRDESAGNMWHDPDKLREKIASLVATDRWTFAFQVPPGLGRNLISILGLAPGNVEEWARTEAGLRDASFSTTSAIGSYFTARSAGKMSVSNFYAATDASKIKKRDLEDLADVTNLCKAINVDRHGEEMKALCERRNKGFVLGAAYYQLTKPEEVQEYKAVMIRRKKDGKVFAGPEARELVGIPAGKRGKVVPGNHGEWDIFVQSTAPNRKPPFGSTVLYRRDHTTPSRPTWNA